MQELEIVKQTIRKAGQAVLDMYQGQAEITIKEGGTPVTTADLASEKIILESLAKFDYGIVSEETSEENNRLEKSKVWVVDPLDGTKGFIHKTGDFTMMIGLVENGNVILGAVYQPTTDTLFFATKGGGAFVESNGKTSPMQVNSAILTADIDMLVSRDHLRPTELAVAEELGITNFKKRGSAGLKASLVGSGTADLYMNTSSKTGEYDICAADIIVTEAGGQISDMNGDTLKYNKEIPMNLNGFVVSNGEHHKEIISILKNIPKS